MATITVDSKKCRNCGACIQVCPNLIFTAGPDKAAAVREDLARHCIRCGQCMAVCPDDAIGVEGVPPSTLAPLEKLSVSPEQLLEFFRHRRSLRAYQDRPVEPAVVEKALEMAAYAPLSLPPWSVEIVTVLGREKVAAIADLICAQIEKLVEMNRGWMGRFFIKRSVGAERYKFMDEHFIPLLAAGVEKYRKQRVDVWLRGAPALMVFHTGPDALDGPPDSILAASQAAMALQALGLGVCFNGMAPGTAKSSPALGRHLGLPPRNTIHTAFTFGYPRVAYRKSVKRAFKATRIIT